MKLTFDPAVVRIEAENLPYNFRDEENNNTISGIAVHPLETNRWFVCMTNGKFFMSEDNGQTWTLTQFLAGGQHLYGAAILPSPADPQVVYFAGSGYGGPGAFKSENGGISFSPITDGLPPTLITDLAATPDGKFIFAASESGPLVYVEEERRWYPLTGEFTPRTTWWSVEYIESLETVRFGTYGRGIWDFRISRQTTSINDQERLIALNVFPNPASDEFRVTLPRPGSVKIISLSGQVYYKSRNDLSEHLIEVNQWPAGIYIAESGSTRSKIVVK